MHEKSINNEHLIFQKNLKTQIPKDLSALIFILLIFM